MGRAGAAYWGHRANLTNASLSSARLINADLSGAILLGANLSGADLSRARNLTQTQLDAACGDANTKLPEGLKPPKPCQAMPPLGGPPPPDIP